MIRTLNLKLDLRISVLIADSVSPTADAEESRPRYLAQVIEDNVRQILMRHEGEVIDGAPGAEMIEQLGTLGCSFNVAEKA